MSKDDEREFRLRPRKPPIPRQKDERLAWSAAYRIIVHYARSSRALKRAGRSGSGRAAAIPNAQRCAIRVTYAKNAVKGHWRAHGRYIARESAAGESKAVGFDQEQHGIDVISALGRWQAVQDARLWKIIISPEFGERLDLTRLTRDLMGRLEKDLHVQFEWVAVAHFNTEHPHVHVALRGVGRNGEEIRLARDYVKTGMRAIAEDYCTRQLGHRTERDAIEAERREIREKCFTSLDRMIVRKAMPGFDEPYSTTMTATADWKPAPGSFSGARQRHMMARLIVLESMGLAWSSANGDWSVHPNLEAILRAMQRTADRQKTLRAHGALLSDERLPMAVFDSRQTASVEGRVIVHGEDEQSGRRYLMLEGVDARVHYVEYTPEMEEARARGELRTNAFVRLRRVFIDEEPALGVEDLGNSEFLLKNRDHFNSKARNLLTGYSPSENGWGGWLGEYNSALVQAAKEIQAPAPQRHQDRERSRGR
jgi:type IV secretory pathway VirD2 relaxase